MGAPTIVTMEQDKEFVLSLVACVSQAGRVKTVVSSTVPLETLAVAMVFAKTFLELTSALVTVAGLVLIAKVKFCPPNTTTCHMGTNFVMERRHHLHSCFK